MSDLKKALALGYQFSIHRRKTDSAIVVAVRKKPGNGHRIFNQVAPGDFDPMQALEVAARASLRLKEENVNGVTK